MRFTITTRLTITSAVLTGLVLLPAGIALYVIFASSIESEGVRETQIAARNLASTVQYQWAPDLMVEYRDGVMPLETLGLDAAHWALVRGDGTVVHSHGIFDLPRVPRAPVGSCLVAGDGGESYRVASVPFFASHPETFEDLPDGVRTTIREQSPGGTFLRAEREFARFKKDPSRGMEIVEVLVLEEEHLLELKMSHEGRLVAKPDREEFDFQKDVPRDLVEMIRGALVDDVDDVDDVGDVEDVSFASWRVHNGQLIAVLAVASKSGERFELATNRVGEKFTVEENGLRPDPASRLWMVTAADVTAELGATHRFLATLWIGVPLIWGAMVLVSWFVSRRALSPVKRIVETVGGIELSRLGDRLPVGEAKDELQSISATINGMLDRIEAGYLRERQFTGDASHELRGPLAKVIADVDVAISQRREGDEYRETLVRCRKYATRMQRLVESLLWLARLDSRGTRSVVDSRSFEVTDLVAEVVRAFPSEEAERIRLNTEEGGQPIHARGDPELIRVLLQNLVQNALRYSRPVDPVEIRVLSANGRATVEIEDRGDGIPRDQLDEVFSRFYRVDKSRSRETGGFGLGLSIVHEIGRVHGFRVALQNRVDSGLLASFSLPVV